MIERSVGISPGIPWAGPLPGGGYSGATEELDAAVMHCAELLEAEFPGVDVEIRFNSHRESGGAWVPAKSEPQFGIGALIVGNGHWAQRFGYKPGDIAFTVYIPAAHLDGCDWGDGHEGRYAHHYRKTAEAALATLKGNLRGDAMGRE